MDNITKGKEIQNKINYENICALSIDLIFLSKVCALPINLGLFYTSHNSKFDCTTRIMFMGKKGWVYSFFQDSMVSFRLPLWDNFGCLMRYEVVSDFWTTLTVTQFFYIYKDSSTIQSSGSKY